MPTIRTQLSHVYWLGGSPCSGKTSAAQWLAEHFGWQYYSCDEAFYRHAVLVTPEHQPTFYRAMHYSCEELWMRPVDVLAVDELAIYREEFPFILEDLLALPAGQPVIAEGAALLPELIAPLLQSPRKAVWMVPSPAFQWQHYQRRDWPKEVLKDCTNPEQAFRNWMARDIDFAAQVSTQATQLGLRLLVVDGSQSLDENIAIVQAHLQPE